MTRIRTDIIRRDAAQARLTREAVAYAFGISVDEIEDRGRGASHAARARQVAMYLAHVAFEQTMTRVALGFGRDRSTVAHACQIVEDGRDDPGFDDFLDRLEAFLRAAPEPGLQSLAA